MPCVTDRKVETELFRRFGTHSQLMSAKELLHHLEQGEAATRPGHHLQLLQGIRPPPMPRMMDSPRNHQHAQLARFLERRPGSTLFDLVVIDEAHYLRNHETSSAMLGQLLRPVADYFILLSATPVNNRSRDLFNLVSLVDPDQFRHEAEFESLLGANRPLVRLANQLKRPSATIGMVREALDEAAQHWLFENSASLKLVRDDLEGKADQEEVSPEERVHESPLDRINCLADHRPLAQR